MMWPISRSAARPPAPATSSPARGRASPSPRSAPRPGTRSSRGTASARTSTARRSSGMSGTGSRSRRPARRSGGRPPVPPTSWRTPRFASGIAGYGISFSPLERHDRFGQLGLQERRRRGLRRHQPSRRSSPRSRDRRSPDGSIATRPPRITPLRSPARAITSSSSAPPTPGGAADDQQGQIYLGSLDVTTDANRSRGLRLRYRLDAARRAIHDRHGDRPDLRPHRGDDRPLQPHPHRRRPRLGGPRRDRLPTPPTPWPPGRS